MSIQLRGSLYFLLAVVNERPTDLYQHGPQIYIKVPDQHIARPSALVLRYGSLPLKSSRIGSLSRFHRRLISFGSWYSSFFPLDLEDPSRRTGWLQDASARFYIAAANNPESIYGYRLVEKGNLFSSLGKNKGGDSVSTGIPRAATNGRIYKSSQQLPASTLLGLAICP
jgi:hypothetical protein